MRSSLFRVARVHGAVALFVVMFVAGCAKQKAAPEKAAPEKAAPEKAGLVEATPPKPVAEPQPVEVAQKVEEAKQEPAGTPPAEAAVPGTETKPAVALPRNLQGVLTYTPLPRTKSVAAYLGVEFTVATEAEKVVLAASTTELRDAMIAASGKSVKLTCVPQPTSTATPRGAYPVGLNGKPMARPAKCLVQVMTVVEPGS